MKNGGGIKMIVIGIVMALLIIGYYYYISNRSMPQPEATVSETEKLSPSQEVLLRNLDTNYPPTPREVVKYFSEISQCFYNEDNTEEMTEKLGLKIRELYDDELKARQTEDDYLASLKFDIEEFKKNNRTISSFTLSASVDVDTFVEQGYECARLYCLYSIKQGELLYKSNTVFVLRKDEDGHYKILGWKLAEDKK